MLPVGISIRSIIFSPDFLSSKMIGLTVISYVERRKAQDSIPNSHFIIKLYSNNFYSDIIKNP